MPTSSVLREASLHPFMQVPPSGLSGKTGKVWFEWTFPFLDSDYLDNNKELPIEIPNTELQKLLRSGRVCSQHFWGRARVKSISVNTVMLP